MNVLSDNAEVLIAFGLFVLSELIGMSKAKENSVLQMLLHMGRELFPYEIQRREPATRQNRPQRRRDANGRYTGDQQATSRRQGR
jgi:hypothetical protein